MKWKREVEVVASDIRSAIEEASLLAVNLKIGVAAADAVPIPIPPIQTNKIGPTMAMMRQVIHQNIPDRANNGWDPVMRKRKSYRSEEKKSAKRKGEGKITFL
ncbi:hypothetical protein C2S52_000712 [Perilla frutescens var. hirtella]|nr:hypothetical protein C2S52_000712 [Perilla frutescens var. hirtella]